MLNYLPENGLGTLNKTAWPEIGGLKESIIFAALSETGGSMAHVQLALRSVI